MAPPEQVIQQYGGKLELEYDAPAYLYRFDFRTALFVPFGIMTTQPTLLSAFNSTGQENIEPPETSKDDSLLSHTIYYSARDHFDDMAKTELLPVDGGKNGGGIHNGKFISINVKDASDLQDRVAQMPRRWMNLDFSKYIEEDKDAFHSAW